jgi:hypothetical protein
MEHFPFYSVAGSEVLLHLLDVEELAASRGNLQCPDRCLFRNFLPNGPILASIPRQIQTVFARSATLFQETLKTAARMHKCGDTLPPTNIVLVAFRPF